MYDVGVRSSMYIEKGSTKSAEKSFFQANKKLLMIIKEVMVEILLFRN